MPQFIPDPSKQHDSGGVFTDGGNKIHQYPDAIQPIAPSSDHGVNPFCKVCIVDESGTAYQQNGENCWVIPTNNVSLLVSGGVDVCDYVIANCPSINSAVSASGNIVRFTNQAGSVTDITISLNSSGCIAGNGTVGSPFILSLDPDGNIVCGPNGLMVSGIISGGGGGSGGTISGCSMSISTENGDCPDAPSAPADPNGSPIDGTVQLEFWDDCLLIWDYDGASWSIDKTVLFASGGGGGAGTITASGCIIGDGSIGDPVRLNLNTAFIVCGVSGLEIVPQPDCCVSGLVVGLVGSTLTVTVTDTDGGEFSDSVVLPSGSVASINTSGCVLGDGTPGDPVRLNLNTSSIVCGVSGLEVVPAPDCCVSGLTVGLVGSTLTVTVTDTDGGEFVDSVVLPSGGGISSISTSGCISGDGSVGDPVVLNLDVSGALLCGLDGLSVLYNGMAEFAQVGSVQPDTNIDDQSRFHVPDGRSIQIIEANVTLGVPSTSGVTVEFHSSVGSATVPGGTNIEDTLAITTGNIYQNWAALEGLVFNGPTHLQKFVTAGNGVGQDLSIQIIYKMW